MDTLIILSTSDSDCQEHIRDKVVDILYNMQIVREIRAFDDEIFVRHTSDAEHDLIFEKMLVDLPQT